MTKYDYFFHMFFQIEIKVKYVHAARVICGLFNCEFAYSLGKMVKIENFLVKNELFICEFKICGPKWQNVFNANSVSEILKFAGKINFKFCCKNETYLA